MRTLNRPMFRYGGPIKEGVMDGIRETRKNGGSMSQSVQPSSNGMRPGYKGKSSLLKYIPGFNYVAGQTKGIIPRIFNRLKPTFKDQPGIVTGGDASTKAKYMSQTMPKVPFSERAKAFVKENPYFTGAAAPFAVSGALTAAPPVAKGLAGLAESGVKQLADLAVPDFIFDQDQYFEDKEKAKLAEELKASKLTANEKKIKDLEALLAGGNEPKVTAKSADELRQDRIQKYRDIMDIKGMNKNAAYDSLIAASQAVLGEGDFKGSIKDGSLINKIIGSTSKAFDKPKATKDAIDTLILKGEIEKDIKSGEPSPYLKTARDMVATGASKNIQEAMKKLTKSENSMSSTLGAILGKGNRLDENNVGVAYRNETGKIPKGSTKISIINEWKSDNEGKNELDYVKELISKGAALVEGDYVIGERVVTIDKSGVPSFFY